MSYKAAAEQIPSRCMITEKSASRARRTAKKAAARLARRAARIDPEGAPTRSYTRGWID